MKNNNVCFAVFGKCYLVLFHSWIVSLHRRCLGRQCWGLIFEVYIQVKLYPFNGTLL